MGLWLLFWLVWWWHSAVVFAFALASAFSLAALSFPFAFSLGIRLGSHGQRFS